MTLEAEMEARDIPPGVGEARGEDRSRQDNNVIDIASATDDKVTAVLKGYRTYANSRATPILVKLFICYKFLELVVKVSNAN